MNPTLRPLIVCSLLALSGTARVLAQHESMPAGMTHEEHMAQMQKDAELKTRGAASMGFDQDTTRHHFTLDATGGAIAVDVVDRSSAVTRAEVRAHLSEIAAQFAQGDFTKPFDTHGEVPPGTSTMAERRGTLTFRY